MSVGFRIYRNNKGTLKAISGITLRRMPGGTVFLARVFLLYQSQFRKEVMRV
jgi:hypothetical protein